VEELVEGWKRKTVSKRRDCMSRLHFHPGEIFAMAQEIERNGAHFYRTVSQKAALEDMRGLLLELAAMEDDHEKIFAAMQQGLSAQQGQAAPQDE
jgi:rubrerythrin